MAVTALKPTGSGETKWVLPHTFFDVLADGSPLPGEEARYAQVLAVLEALETNPAVKARVIEAAAEVEEQVIEPLFQFRNYGHHLSTASGRRPCTTPNISLQRTRWDAGVIHAEDHQQDLLDALQEVQRRASKVCKLVLPVTVSYSAISGIIVHQTFELRANEPHHFQRLLQPDVDTCTFRRGRHSTSIC